MRKLKYLEPKSLQTLQEGMQELRAAELDNDASETMAPELARDLDEHDAIHTLFACTTDLKGEVIVHIWTVFGTTMSMRQMRKVNAHDDHKQALRAIGHRKLLGTWLLNLPKILGIALRARHMTRKFPVSGYERYLDKRLCDLREEFRIRL